MTRSFVVFGGSNERAVVAFLRCLEACGHTPYIVARTESDPLLRTSHAKNVVYRRDSHALNLEVFTRCIHAVRAHASEEELVVLPSSEYFNEFLLLHRDEVEALGCRCPLPDAEIYRELTSKQSSTALFAGWGCKVPQTLKDAHAGDLPLVAKPRHNIHPDGRSLYPVLIEDIKALDAFAKSHNPDEHFFQEYIHGESHYLLFHLCRNGTAVTWSQRNLLQQPGGKSMLLAEPSNFHRSECAHLMIEGLRNRGFSGIGMIEVIGDERSWTFIEMNPRIWGPMQFTLDQRIPILPAFIGECLYDDAERFIPLFLADHPRRRAFYAWLGGIASTLGQKGRMCWHAPRLPFIRLLRLAMLNDIYLRKDSWRLFLHELFTALTQSFRRERP